MLSINLSRIRNEQEKFGTMIARYKSFLIEIDSILISLSSLSGMEDVISNLNRNKIRIESECRGLISLSEALQKIQYIYNSCENRVMDESEGIRYVYKRHGTTLIDNSDKIKGLKLVNIKF